MVRYKNRYLVVQLSILKDVNMNTSRMENDLKLSMLNTLKLLHGDFGVGSLQTCFKICYCDLTTKIVVFKTRHGPHIFLFSIIPFINNVQEKPIQLSSLYTGASLFQCHKFIQNYQKNLVRKFSTTINTTTKQNM